MADANLPDSSDASGSKPLEYWRRSVSARRRWLPGRFADWGPKLFKGFKTFLWVFPLTVLIWLYAEREQQMSKTDVSVQIGVHLNDPEKLVKLIDPENGMVTVDLYGPRVGIEHLEQELRVPYEGKSPIVIQVPPNLPAAGAQTPLSVINELANNPVFTNEGVTVTKVSPANIWVEVDDWHEEELPVKAPPGLDTLDGEPVFSPANIHVRAPASYFARAKKSNQLAVIADLSKRPELTEPGPHDITNVPVSWFIQDNFVKLSQHTVRASIDVKQRDTKLLLNSVPIWTSAPPGFLDRNRVEIIGPPVIANVTLVGPPDKIAAIDPHEVKARLEVSTADLHPDVEQHKLVKFEVPFEKDGVHVVDENTVGRVNFKIVSRNGGE